MVGKRLWLVFSPLSLQGRVRPGGWRPSDSGTRCCPSSASRDFLSQTYGCVRPGPRLPCCPRTSSLLHEERQRQLAISLQLCPLLFASFDRQHSATRCTSQDDCSATELPKAVSNPWILVLAQEEGSTFHAMRDPGIAVERCLGVCA